MSAIIVSEYAIICILKSLDLDDHTQPSVTRLCGVGSVWTLAQETGRNREHCMCRIKEVLLPSRPPANQRLSLFLPQNPAGTSS